MRSVAVGVLVALLWLFPVGACVYRVLIHTWLVCTARLCAKSCSATARNRCHCRLCFGVGSDDARSALPESLFMDSLDLLGGQCPELACHGSVACPIAVEPTVCLTLASRRTVANLQVSDW